MNKKLKKSAKSVQDALDAHGVSCNVFELPGSTRTAEEAARSIGCDVKEIAKTLIFKTKKSSKPVLVLAAGPNRVDEDKISSLVDEDIKKADAQFTRAITGFAIGGIPPIGHKHPIALAFIDQELLKLRKIWVAAGTPNAVFSIQPDELQKVLKGEVVSLC